MSTNLGYAAHVPGRLLTLLLATCGSSTTSDQSVVCSAITEACSNFTYNCSNIKSNTFTCSLEDKIAMAYTAVSAEPPAVLAEMSKKHENIKQDLTNAIQSNCSQAAMASQSITSSIKCTNSSAVLVDVLNTMDAITACVATQASTMVAEARQAVAEGSLKSPPLSNTAVIGVSLAGALVIAILLLFALWKGGSGA